MAARTAVVAGTATAVSGHVQNKQAQKQMAAQQQAYDEQQAQAQQAQAQQAQAPAAGGNDMIAQLAQLGQMKEQGLLSDAEFAEAKAKLLGS